ncbi:MAG: glutamyl-tRNA reductase, partial [Bacteroidetes bacterium]|nr:glutamyl-tRNA reductase [Bacteroidota bacterium]
MQTGLNILAFTHRNLDVSKIGLLHIDKSDQPERLHAIKSKLRLNELCFLTTCNRVEFTFICEFEWQEEHTYNLLSALYPNLQNPNITEFVNHVEHYAECKAVDHAFAVASSIDSMIIGEREIITQVRTAFEFCREHGLTGDLIRILMKQVIETAKKVYTETSIASKPVSVVSLAYHRLKKFNIPLDARILFIGAGVTITTMARFLKKHGFKNFVVFNRTYEKAHTLAEEIRGIPMALADLKNYQNGFDVIITCTGADNHIINKEIYEILLVGEKNKKIVIDLAIPQDLDPEIVEKHKIDYISVAHLQVISNENLKERTKEIKHVEEILSQGNADFFALLKERTVERAMREVPEQIKSIKSAAINEIFRKDIENLDPQS